MEFTIIGGGIAGLTMALALRKAGKNVKVYEATPEIQPLGAGLGLAANAIGAFEALGVREELIPRGRLINSFAIFDQQGRIIQRSHQGFGMENFAIHRAQLHDFLLSKLPAGVVRTHKRLMDIRQDIHGVELSFQDGSSVWTDYVIVADGIHSVARKKYLPAAAERYAGYTCWRAVIKNEHIPVQESSETWGSRGRFGMVPLSEEKLYWFACIKAPANDPACRQFRVEDLLIRFGDYHEPIPQILAATRDEDLIWNDIVDIDPIDRYAFGRILLIGDAAHATTPNMGQGACQAIEDCVVLANCIQRTSDPYQAFQTFEQERLSRTHWVMRSSRRLGEIAQLENPLLAGLRNSAMRMVPPAMQDRMWRKLHDVQFAPV